jgi:hydrogenase maturation protease
MNFKDLLEILAEYRRDKIIFVGLGNPLCGDDAAGQILIEKLAEQSELEGATFLFAGTTPENFLEKIVAQAPDVVIFIDTARFCAVPGTIGILEERNLPPTDFSTHTFSIEMIAAYITSVKACRIVYLGIEPKNTEINAPLSDNVQAGLEKFFKDRDAQNA